MPVSVLFPLITNRVLAFSFGFEDETTTTTTLDNESWPSSADSVMSNLMITGPVIGLLAIVVIGGLTYWLCYKRGQSLTLETSKKEASNKAESDSRQRLNMPTLATKGNTPPEGEEDPKAQPKKNKTKKNTTKPKDGGEKAKLSSKSNRQSKPTNSPQEG